MKTPRTPWLPELRAVTLVGCLGLAASAPATAEWPPEKITNLQVLPEDIELRELAGIMRGFSEGLGVRCHHCHTHSGDDPDDLASLDFAADDKPAKQKARIMLRMTRAINEGYLPEVDGELGLRVTCETCHHGREHPESLEDTLERELAAAGIQAAIDRYRALRSELYGGWAYDFGEDPLNRLAQQLLRSERTAEAIALLELNLDHYPEAEWAGTLYGEALSAAGRSDEARRQFERVVELHPESSFAIRRLAELAGEPSDDP